MVMMSSTARRSVPLYVATSSRDAAGEERVEVVDPELLEPVGPTHLLLGHAVVVADLVADLVRDVAEPVELRPDLPDLAAGR
jgi:hypothetical protein